jgi:hypothetical protein
LDVFGCQVSEARPGAPGFYLKKGRWEIILTKLHLTGVRWCIYQRGTLMARRAESEPSTRTSVTFPAEVYASLEIIAKQKKVSMAWVIRDAAEKYVSEHWPLFAGAKHG